ncbi:hypothetical protein MMC14_009642 [Varicellaria rhodocarpa]|nr:hypothetical protein [Varicellaria rhodocarpa]
MLFHPLPLAAAALMFLTQSEACLSLAAVKFADTVVSAQIHDNGVNTCNFPNSAALGQDNQYWFQCQSGFAAWLSEDLGTLAYSNSGSNYRIVVTVTGTDEECDPLTGACGTATRYTASAFC